MATLALVLAPLPGTSTQLLAMPVLILLVCNCSTQPKYDAGQLKEIEPPDTLFVNVGGESGPTVATLTVPSTVKLAVFQVTT